MSRLLLVSDNRIFIKHLLEMLQECTEHTIAVEFYSISIFDAYLKHMPDIIIFDNTNILPLQSALNQFAKYHWKCPFIVILEEVPTYQNKLVFYSAANKDSILSLINQLDVSVKNTFDTSSLQRYPRGWWENISPTPDTYFLMLSVSMDFEEEISEASFNSLKEKVLCIGKPLIITHIQNDIFIFMQKTKINNPETFYQLHDIICHEIHKHYASVFSENIAVDVVDAQAVFMLGLTSVCRCFSSQSYRLENINMLLDSKPAIDIYNYFLSLTLAVFSKDYEQLQLLLQRLFLCDIKLNLAIEYLPVFKTGQDFLFHTIFSKYSINDECCTTSRTSLETEYNNSLNIWTKVYTGYHKHPFSPIVCNSLSVLMHEYKNPEVSLDYVVQKLGFTKSYISRIFKEQTGLTLVLFLQKLRIEVARYFLSYTEMSVKDISHKTGYIDTLYFSKLFKRHIGIYPTEYRLQFPSSSLKIPPI